MTDFIWVDPVHITPNRLVAEAYTIEYLSLESQLNQAMKRFEQKSLGKLGKLFTGPFGSKLPTSVFVDEGIPLLRVQNVGEIELLSDNLVNIGPETHQDIIRSRLHSGDLAISKAGDLGTTAIIPESMAECNITQHIVGVRINRNAIDNYFLAAFLTSSYGRFQFKRQGVGTLLKYLGVEDTRNTHVVVPPRPLQTYIGDKVRLAEQCRRNGRELWDKSQSVLEKALELPLKATYWEEVNPLELRSSTYNLVSVEPSAAWVTPKLVERELGAQNFHPRRANVILKLESSGIELKRLSAVASRQTQRVSANKLHTIPYYVGLAEIDTTTGYFDPVPMQESSVSGTSTLFHSDNILFSKLRPYLNKVTICPPHVKTACGSTELLVYHVNKPFLPYYIFFLLKSSLSLYQIIDVTAGSTLPRVDPEIVDDILVPMIPQEQQKDIDRYVRQMIALQHQATKLIREAKADVESLIEGRLDVEGIMNGRLQPPTWASIQEELAVTESVSQPG